MKRSYKRLIWGLLILILVFSVVRLLKWQQDNQFYRETLFTMDTFVEVSAQGKGAKNAVQKALDVFKQLDKKFAPGKNAEIQRINAAAGNKEVRVSKDTIEVIKRSIELSRRVGGAFDITVGPVVELWGFGGSQANVPDPAQLKSKLGLVDYRKIMINEKAGTVKLKEKGMVIDVGGVAKGYAVDKAYEALKKQGIKSALINGGTSSIRVIGKSPRGYDWHIAIGHPRKEGKFLGILSLKSGQAIGTSGDYQRFFWKNGIRYFHILDPKTGYPARGLMSVTVITPDATEGDILSTALFVLGKDKGMELVGKLKNVQAVFVADDKKIFVTPGRMKRKDFKF